MIYSLFTDIISSVQVFWVSSFYLSINIVVLYKFMLYRNLKREVCRTEKRLRLQLFWAVDDVPEKEVMDLWKQMSSKWSFTCICGIFCPVNLSTTIIQFILDLHFAPSLMRFTLSLQSVLIFFHSVWILPLVCSLQSTVYILHWPL